MDLHEEIERKKEELRKLETKLWNQEHEKSEDFKELNRVLKEAMMANTSPVIPYIRSLMQKELEKKSRE